MLQDLSAWARHVDVARGVQVCTELDNHVGVGDKTLAEFIIDLAEKNGDIPAFQRALEENGAEFPDSFVASLYALIHRLLPKKAPLSASETAKKEVAEKSTEKFPGLAMKNSKPIKLTPSPPRMPSPPRRDEQRRDSRDDRDDRRRDGRDRDRYRDSRDGDGYDRDRRDRRDDRDDRGRPPLPPADKEPVIGGVYRGTVANGLDFGVFVALSQFGRREGLLHISQITGRGKILSGKDAFRRNESLWVKVVSITGTKLSFTMRDIDQDTGRDNSSVSLTANQRSNPSRPSAAEERVSGIPVNEDDRDVVSRRPRQRLSSPEMWEAQQLIASGVLSVEDYPTYDEEQGMLAPRDEDDADDIEIELNEDEPAFLKGQTKLSLNLSPIKVVKNPDGSLQRAALTQSALAKERREIKDQQQRALMESAPKDLGRTWADPLAAPGERMLSQELAGIGATAPEIEEWRTQTMGSGGTTVGYRATDRTIKEQRESLPIYLFRDAFLKSMQEHQILIVIGETGSGKTTQMPQYLAEAGYTAKGRIGVTQPRRVAAMSVAKRVAEEFGCRLGQEVGYTIRFEDCTSPETKIKFMTDGMLLRECLIDTEVSAYSVVMLDEAHERTIHTDVLFSLMKEAARQRPDLKLIVTSATMEAEKYSEYFNKCPVFTVPGRTFPVEILYCKTPESDYLDASLITVMQIHLAEPPGDILLFLTGQEEIDTACNILFDRMKSLGKLAPKLNIFPVYSTLPSEMQTRIFDPTPPGERKVIVATNIAEASLTIDGIFYVIDPGFAKQKVFNPKTGVDALVVTPISQASAKQRSGRAGRTGPGKCYRLYTEVAFKQEMMPMSVPEIQRANLGSTVLQLKAMGINDIIHFDFMDPPPVQTLINAMETLYSLGALDEEGLLTRLGRRMAEFPLDPTLSKVLLAAVDLSCAEEMLTIVAMLSVETLFYRPKDKAAEADQKKSKFYQPEGDHLTLLAVYEAWKHNKFSNPWCYENFLHARSLRRAQDVRKQILQIMDRHKLDLMSAGKNYNKVRKALVSGFFHHAAKKDAQEGYRTLSDGTPCYIHPSSALFNRNPEMLIYNELVRTSASLPLLPPSSPVPRPLTGSPLCAGDHHQGVHAQRDPDRAQVADRVRAALLQGRGPEQALQAQADGEDRAALQPLRGEGRLAPLQAPRLSAARGWLTPRRRLQRARIRTPHLAAMAVRSI